MFKRETASSFKADYPNMKNSERQVIVKEHWKHMGEKDKAVFVYLARVEEEKQHQEAKQKFFNMRVEDYYRQL